MPTEAASILLIGYGNPGRLDDGLGPAFAAAVAEMCIDGVTVDSNYQLQVEDAADIARHDVVIFADAHVSCPDPFVFHRIEPAAEASFTSHSISPPSLLAMARDLFSARAQGYVLGIRGYEFDEFDERLSSKARANLDSALAFVEPVLRNRAFEVSANDSGAACACGSAL